MRAAWSREAGLAHLRELERRVDEDGGAAILTPRGLVVAVTGRKVSSRKNRDEARAMLGSRRGWSGRESATRGAVLVYGGERPPDDFFKDFGGRLRSLTETTRHINPHGPASVSMVGVNMWGERIEGDDLFLAPWGALVFESLGWRRAQCPPDVDPLDVAWYPPAKDGSP